MSVSAASTNMSAPIPHFIAVEVCRAAMIRRRMFTAGGHYTVIAVMWIEMIVHMAMESMRAMEPWAGSNEDPIHKPRRSIISVRGAVIGRKVVITIWTNRFRADVDANADLRLSPGHGHNA